MADRAIDRLIEMDRASPKSILVLGDAIEDVWVHGTLHECQDGCPKFVEHHRVSVPGGAANAARQLTEWCSRAYLNAGTYTPVSSVKTRYVVDGRIVFREDAEHPVHCPQIYLAILRAVRNYHAVLISDYDKGTLSRDFIRQVISECKVLVVSDAKREPEIYAGSILKCNNNYCNRHQAALLRWPYPVICTSGDYTPDVYLPSRESRDIPHRPKVTCVNHVGAGDCFAAHLVLALAHGLLMEDAAEVAHSAGRVYVQREHGLPPLPQEIKDDLETT